MVEFDQSFATLIIIARFYSVHVKCNTQNIKLEIQFRSENW